MRVPSNDPREAQTESPHHASLPSIGFASGAAMAVRADVLRHHGLFDPLYFAYLEDAELTWKLRQLGYDIVLHPASVVWHKYQFKSDYRHYFLLERNRWLLLATYYRWPTLALLLPAIVFMEVGQFYFAWRQGVLRQKVRACRVVLSRPMRRRLLAQRERAQSRRRIGDRSFARSLTGSISFSELTSPLLRYVASPLLGTYWRLVRRMIFWG